MWSERTGAKSAFYGSHAPALLGLPRPERRQGVPDLVCGYSVTAADLATS
jgi:hypothetical protein